MTAREFNLTVLLLWGEKWRDAFREFLKTHSIEPSRTTVWRWQADKLAVPKYVALLLERERRKKAS